MERRLQVQIKKHSTAMQAYGSIQKGISRHDNKHQVLNCKRYISVEVKRAHSKNKKVTKLFADKTSNIYEMPKQQHKKLLHDNVTKTYNKVPPKLETLVNLEAKDITQLINLHKRIECIGRSPTFITLKDHKPDFWQNPSRQLTNPAKDEHGNVSRLIILKINEKLILDLHFNQRKNTDSVLKWFIDKEFYPSINKDILTNVIQFAKLHTTIDDKDFRLIVLRRKSLLLLGNETWKKKPAKSCFDVTMGRFDGAGICELVGIYIQINLENTIRKTNFGL